MSDTVDDQVTERVGRLFLEAVRLDMEEPGDALARARKALAHGVGGFIVFGGALPEVRRLAAALREDAARPLWMAADLERGAGQQFEGGVTLPPPAGLAAHPEPEEAVRAAARITAREARQAGLNWVFAPVLDLDVEPENPIVGTRSFGSDPEAVARLGQIWIEACQAEGVAACAKHFPGHGRTTEDSHLAFPVVRAGREQLRDDLRPFRRAAPTVAAMMTAHVGYPALGGEAAATMEPAVLRDLLRGEMGFGGLVISDALVMEGFGGGGETATEGWLAVRALRAGCDLLLYPGDLPTTVRTVRQAAEQDPELREVLAAALERSDEALRRFPVQVEAAAGAPSAGPPGAGSADGLAAGARAGELAVECISARGAGPAEALDRDREVQIAVVSDDEGAVAAGRFGEAFADELRDRGWSVPRGDEGGSGRETGGGGADAGRGDGGSRGAGDGSRRVVLLEATPRAWKGRASLSEACRDEVLAALDDADHGYLVLFGHPRILDQLGVDGACAWSSEPAMERAAARWVDEAVR